MSTTTEGVAGFTGADIDDVARVTALSLGIEFDALTDAQKAGYSAAARGALTSERPKGFAQHLTEGFGDETHRSKLPAVKAAYDDACTTAQATESEFWKFARDEFDRRRAK